MSDYSIRIEEILAQAQAEAYARGWREAIAAVTAKAFELKGAPVPTKETTPSLLINGDKPQSAAKPRGRPSTAVAAILGVIREEPGLRGIDIVGRLESKGVPTNDRTVRSALRRLKGQEVWQRSQRWYPKHKSNGINAADEVDKEFGEALGTPPH